MRLISYVTGQKVRKVWAADADFLTLVKLARSVIRFLPSLVNADTWPEEHADAHCLPFLHLHPAELCVGVTRQNFPPLSSRAAARPHSCTPAGISEHLSPPAARLSNSARPSSSSSSIFQRLSQRLGNTLSSHTEPIWQSNTWEGVFTDSPAHTRRELLP